MIPKSLRWPLGLFAVVFILAAAMIWPVLRDADQVLAFNDGNIESQLAPGTGFPGYLFRIWDNQFFFGTGSSGYPLTVTALGECIGPEFYRRWAQVWIPALCALGLFWALRQYRISRLPAAIVAAMLVFTGWPFNSAITGLAVRMIALTCSAVALGFVERGRITGQWLPYAIGGGFLGLAVAEVPDIGLLFAFSTAVVFWWTHLGEKQEAESRKQKWGGGGEKTSDFRLQTSDIRLQTSDIRPETEDRIDVALEGGAPATPVLADTPAKDGVAGAPPSSHESRIPCPISLPKRSVVCGLWSVVFRFALYVGFSVLLAWQTISVTYSGGIKGVTQGGSESPQERYNWATQWSLPPAELWNAVSGSYFGTSMNSPTKPYWGRNGRTPGWETTRQGMRNFVLTGWHIGVIPCTLLLALLALALRSLRSRPSSITGGRRSPPAERKRKGPGVGTSAPLLGGAGGGSEFAQRQLQPTPNPSQGGERLPTVHRPLPTAHCSPPSALGPLPSLPWLILTGAAVTMMLMWGRHFFLYKLFWSLPYMSTFRCADKWIGPLLLFTGLGSAVVLDAIWKSLSGKDARSSAEGADQTPSRTSVQIPHDNGLWRILAYAFGGMALLALLIAIGTAGQHNAFIAARTAEGYQELAELMWSNAINASFKVFLIAGLCAAGAWWVGRRQAKGLQTSPVIVLATIGIIAAADLWIANRPYVNGHKYKHFLQPNPLTDYLDAHRNEGRIKLMPPNHPLLNNIRMTLLQVKGYDLFDPVSVSRMPTDYAALFKALDANPARLWELGSLRYFLTLPGAAEQLNRMDGNRGRFVERLALGIGVVDGSYLPVATGDPKQQYLRLVEFTGALPLFRLATKVITVAPTPEGDEQALRMLSAPGFDPSIAIWHAATNWPKEFPFAEGTGTVSVKSQSPSHIAITVYAATRCMLVRTCKFDDQWHAAIDGVRTNIERVDALFQGLIVPQGQHEIVLNYKPPAHMLATALAMRATLFLLCMFHLRHKSPRILQET